MRDKRANGRGGAFPVRAMIRGVAAGGVMLFAMPAWSGPPYVTDDPEPTDPGHWEIYNFALGTADDTGHLYNYGLDINYGGAKDLQLTATLPLESGTGEALGPGDVELAAKYKFLHQHGGSVMPDVAVFPRFILATGRDLTATQLLLPVWAEYDRGKWSLFGGGGYTFVLGRGHGERGYWQPGVVLTRELRPGFVMGLEYTGQGPASVGAGWVHSVNLGTQIHLHGPFSLLGSWGKGINQRQTIFYSSLKLDL